MGSIIQDYSNLYSSHLGRLGLAKINEILKPNICFISEFGEELKGLRIRFSKIYNEGFLNRTLFFPADIGLKYNLNTNKIQAICRLDLEKLTLHSDYYKYIDPKKTMVCELMKDYSLHYYDQKGKFTKSQLTEVLTNMFEISRK